MVMLRPSSLLMMLSPLINSVIHGISTALISMPSSGGGLNRDEPLLRECDRGDEWPRGVHPDAGIVGSKMPGWRLDVIQNHEMTRESSGGALNLLAAHRKGPPFRRGFQGRQPRSKK
jgi:hypothetical protein